MSSFNVSQQIRACLTDEASYKANRKLIIAQVTMSNKNYIVALVDTVKKVLKDRNEQGSSKFLSLFFLKEAMDSKDSNLAGYVKDKLLTRLSKIAKNSVSTVFPPNTERRVIKNFYQLLLECIYFWSQWFGKDNKGKPTKYRSILEDVANKIEIPKKASFFMKEKFLKDKPENTNSEPSETSSHNQSQLKNEGVSGVDSRIPYREEGNALTVGKRPHKVQKIEATLKALDDNKEYLMSALTHSKNPDNNILKAIREKFNESNKKLQDSLPTLREFDFPEKDSIMTRVLEGSAFTAMYIEQYDNLARGKILMPQFKANFINTIMVLKGKESLKKNKRRSSPESQSQSKPEKRKLEDIKPLGLNKVSPEKNGRNSNLHFDPENASLPNEQDQSGEQPGPFDPLQSTFTHLIAGRDSAPFENFREFSTTNQIQTHNTFESPPPRQSGGQQDYLESPNKVIGQEKSAPEHLEFKDFADFEDKQQDEQKSLSRLFQVEESKREEFDTPSISQEHHQAEYSGVRYPVKAEEKSRDTNEFENIEKIKEKNPPKFPSVGEGAGFDDLAVVNFDNATKNIDSKSDFDSQGGRKEIETPNSLTGQDVLDNFESARKENSEHLTSDNTSSNKESHTEQVFDNQKETKIPNSNDFDVIFRTNENQRVFENCFVWDEPVIDTFEPHTKTATEKAENIPSQNIEWRLEDPHNEL